MTTARIFTPVTGFQKNFSRVGGKRVSACVEAATANVGQLADSSLARVRECLADFSAAVGDPAVRPGPAPIDAMERASNEVLALAQVAGRPDLAILMRTGLHLVLAVRGADKWRPETFSPLLAAITLCMAGSLPAAQLRMVDAELQKCVDWYAA